MKQTFSFVPSDFDGGYIGDCAIDNLAKRLKIPNFGGTTFDGDMVTSHPMFKKIAAFVKVTDNMGFSDTLMSRDTYQKLKENINEPGYEAEVTFEFL